MYHALYTVRVGKERTVVEEDTSESTNQTSKIDACSVMSMGMGKPCNLFFQATTFQFRYKKKKTTLQFPSKNIYRPAASNELFFSLQVLLLAKTAKGRYKRKWPMNFYEATNTATCNIRFLLQIPRLIFLGNII